MRTKDGSYPAPAPARAARLKEDVPKQSGRASWLLDTRVIYCGDCLSWVDPGSLLTFDSF